jgi:hypothetical protein
MVVVAGWAMHPKLPSHNRYVLATPCSFSDRRFICSEHVLINNLPIDKGLFLVPLDGQKGVGITRVSYGLFAESAKFPEALWQENQWVCKWIKFFINRTARKVRFVVNDPHIDSGVANDLSWGAPTVLRDNSLSILALHERPKCRQKPSPFRIDKDLRVQQGGFSAPFRGVGSFASLALVAWSTWPALRAKRNW